MHDIQMHDAFVPDGCEHTMQPQPAVTVGAGTFGMQAYTAVTTEGGKYVQGGGCLTVGLAGLLQGGGFGSFSKHYGTAAASLLEAEVVTADGKIRIANACTMKVMMKRPVASTPARDARNSTLVSFGLASFLDSRFLLCRFVICCFSLAVVSLSRPILAKSGLCA